MENKTHIIFITLILLIIIFAAYMMNHFKEPPQTIPDGPIVIDETRFIKIVRASWGRNCHGKKRSVSPTVTLGITKEGTYETPPHNVPENNAYKAIAEKCDNHPSCTIKATSDFIGFDPAPNCSKKFTVEYRCFSYDTPWIKKAKQKQPLEINCIKEEKKNK